MVFHKKAPVLSIFLLLAQVATHIAAQKSPESYQQAQDVLNQKLNSDPKKEKKTTRKQKLINFKFDNVELIDIINQLAAEKGVNIVLPSGDKAITNKVTLNFNDKITLDQAWNMLYTILDVAGYSMIPKHDTYVIVKNDQNITRQGLPVYLNTPVDQLPDSEKRIVYLYYFTNLVVPQGASGTNDDIDAIIKELLPNSSAWKYDYLSNGVIMVDQANNIKTALKILKELDRVGYQETPEIIRLRYVQADVVAELFNKNILMQQARAGFQPAGRKGSDALYFSPNIRVVAEPRTNSLLIIGKTQDNERVKDFIENYVDVKLDSGRSILHTYQLQYLEAEPFAKVLENIVNSASSAGGTAQSKAAGKGPSGPERFFEGVIVTTDTPRGAKPTGTVAGEYYGGNKLIVAARSDDWERIKMLIEELDTPMPTVIIEVLIADLTINDDRILGNLMRNPAAIPFPIIGNSLQSMNVQTAEIPTANTVIPGVVTSVDTAAPRNSTIAGNLLPPGANNNIASTIAGNAPGSMLISLNDANGNTYSLIQVLQSYGNTKILSHPHVIGTHNRKTTVSIGEIRLVPAEAVGASGGTTTAKFKEIKADLKVEITPRISNANTVNLTIDIDINEFSGTAATSNPASNGNRITRKINTNATIHSSDVLALGGLIKNTTTTGINKVPILGDIPLLGWLFKREGNSVIKNNLTAFIRPTIIEPRLRGGVSDYTKNYIQLSREYAKEATLFDSLRDPVTRWFFKTGADGDAAINNFIAQHPDPAIVAEQQIAVANADKTAQTPAPISITAKNDPIKEQVLQAEEKLAVNNKRAQELQALLSNEENPLLTNKQVVG